MADDISAHSNNNSAGKGELDFLYAAVVHSPSRTSTSGVSLLQSPVATKTSIAQETAQSVKTPGNPNELNLAALSIDEANPPPPVAPHTAGDRAGRYTNPFHRGVKSPSGASAYEPPREFVRSSTRGGYGRGGGSYRNSRTWISPDQQAHQDYLTVRNAMRRLFRHSDVAGWKFPDFVAHREAMTRAKAKDLAARIKAREEAKNQLVDAIDAEEQQKLIDCGLHGNWEEVGNRGRVLGQPTIWCRDWATGKDEIAPWPCLAEMKWEGDDRSKTGVGRFLPLPREQGPPSICWNQLPIVDPYPMDVVAPIPTMEDIYLPVDPDIEPEKEYLWSKELDEAIAESVE